MLTFLVFIDRLPVDTDSVLGWGSSVMNKTHPFPLIVCYPSTKDRFTNIYVHSNMLNGELEQQALNSTYVLPYM